MNRTWVGNGAVPAELEMKPYFVSVCVMASAEESENVALSSFCIASYYNLWKTGGLELGVSGA